MHVLYFAPISTLAKPVESYVSEIWQAWASWKSRKPCELATRSVDLEELPPCLWTKRICSICQSVKLELINGNPAAANINPSDGLGLVKSEESLFGLAAFCSSTGCPLFAVPIERKQRVKPGIAMEGNFYVAALEITQRDNAILWYVLMKKRKYMTCLKIFSPLFF